MAKRAQALIQSERRSGRGTGQQNPIDAHVGARVRLRRTLLGLSQEKLGAQLGLTFQQVQKYERGTNRISASRLHALSTILDVPVSFFDRRHRECTACRRGPQHPEPRTTPAE